MAELPDKLYYSIREVAEHTGVEPHVLRYWESEFPHLKPKRSRAGSRSYRKKDIADIKTIQRLLHDEGYRIDGARKYLKDLRKNKTAPKAEAPQLTISFNQMDQAEKMKLIRTDLQEIKKLLADMKQTEPEST
jgi:DNA-binding transcriptional MerR regulator